MHETAFVYGDEYLRYDFGTFHPLRPERLKLTERLATHLGLLAKPNVTVVRPRIASEQELCSVHEPEHVSLVRKLSETGTGLLDSGDTPAFKGMFEAASFWAGGSLVAAELIAEGRVQHAFNIGGGLHHAGKSSSAGFCIFNDVAIAARALHDKHGFKRIFMLDIDAHHGNGTQEILFGDSHFLKVDFHESGLYLYPGSGFVDELGEGDGRGYMVNVPLPPYTDDETYLQLFEEIVPPLLQAFKPEIIIQQTGADGYRLDELTTMGLSTHTYEEVTRRMHAFSHIYCDGRYLLMGGGGYDVAAVPRIWTLVLAEIIGAKISDELPTTWLEDFPKLSSREPPRELRDRPEPPELRMREKIKVETAEVLADIRKTIFPLHGIS